jgi:hypothetical protein
VTEALEAVGPPPATDLVDTVAMPAAEIAETVGGVAGSVEVLPEAAVNAGADAVGGMDGTVQELAAPLGEIPDAIIPLEDLAQALPIAITLGIAALGASAIVRGGWSPAVSVAFTNVRLIPCVASETVHRIVPGFAGETGASTSGTAPRARGSLTGRQSSGGVIDVIREGFDRGAGRVLPVEDGNGEGLRDSRLLAQLGIVLGMVYLAFLTVWFWATRLRWNPRRLT